MTAVDAESCAVVAVAADIICSLRGADLAGWTPPWRSRDAAAPALPSACDGGGGGQEVGGDGAGGMAWPAVARGKRSRSRRAGTPSASGSASAGATTAKDDAEKKEKKKKVRRGARGSPASPLDFSGGGSGSGASTSGGEDGAFCSQPAPSAAAAAVYQPAAAPIIKVGALAGRRSILPVPPPRPAGQRPRKKMRLPEIQQLVRSLSVENDALREEMKALQTACTALSKENGKLETRLHHSSKRNGMNSAEDKGKPKPGPQEAAAEQDTRNGFVLPDLNLPADD